MKILKIVCNVDSFHSPLHSIPIGSNDAMPLLAKSIVKLKVVHIVMIIRVKISFFIVQHTKIMKNTCRHYISVLISNMSCMSIHVCNLLNRRFRTPKALSITVLLLDMQVLYSFCWLVKCPFLCMVSLAIWWFDKLHQPVWCTDLADIWP